MSHFIAALVGLIGGALCVFVATERRRKQLKEQAQQQNSKAEELQSASIAIRKKEAHIEREMSRFVSFRELQDENSILKNDLRNLDINLRKLQLDRKQVRESQGVIDQKCSELGGRYLRDQVKWIGASLTANNYANCKERLQRAIEACRSIGLAVSTMEEAALQADLKQQFELVVRATLEREEQARIKARIREEQALQREVERELRKIDNERNAIQMALERALQQAKNMYSEEVETLKARLAEAEAKAQRAISQAQLTKSGNVYVISNIGSFGEGVFKVGMTRRLEPMDRIRELGDASVPFPFDVHMMIASDDAPTLENALHRALHKNQINKANPRKEYFRTDIETILSVVKQHHGDVQYVADAEALEYRQSMTMSAEDQDFIESVYDELEDDGEVTADAA